MDNVINNVTKGLILILIGYILVLFVVGCGTTGSGGTPPDPAATLSAVYVSPNQANIRVGESQQFNATGSFSDGTTRSIDVIWTLDDQLGSVSSSGLFTATTVGITLVNATNSNKSGSSSIIVNAAGAVIPDTPSTPSGTTTITSATVSWNSVSNAVGYILSYGTDAAATNIGTLSSTSTSKNISSLVNNTTYYVKVLAYSTTGTSSYSDIKALTTESGIPSQPTGVSAGLISNNSARVLWTAVTGATSYNVGYGKTESASDGVEVTTEAIVKLDGLDFGTTYYVTVCAVSQYGASSATDAYSFDTTEEFEIETVDSAGQVGEYCDIAIDQNYKAHISYYDAGTVHLKYATNASGSWYTQYADDTASTQRGKYTSIALDSLGKPYISYYAITAKDLYCAYPSLTIGWINTLVDSGGSIFNDAGQYSSIAISSFGYPQISYYSNEYFGIWHLEYASYNGTSWSNEPVTGSEKGGMYSSLVLDSSNNALIAHYKENGVGGTLEVSGNTTGSWGSLVIASVNGFKLGKYCSATLNKSTNQGYISYYEEGKNRLKCTQVAKSGGVWGVIRTDTVDSSGNVGKYTSAAIDSNNYAHVSYYDVDNTALKYATNKSGSWVIKTIDNTADVGMYSSIAVKGNNVYICYFDNTNKTLKYAILE